jgi:hypothetical protein
MLRVPLSVLCREITTAASIECDGITEYIRPLASRHLIVSQYQGSRANSSAFGIWGSSPARSCSGRWAARPPSVPNHAHRTESSRVVLFHFTRY